MDALVDLADVQRLIAIVERHGLEALTVVDDAVEIRIVAEGVATAAAPTAAVAPVVVDETPSHLFALKSPITGVFYRSGSPSDPPFVQAGDAVEEHETVCLIEAMKIFNEIPAGVQGRLVRVLAANEQLVLTGEVIMEFEPLEGTAP